MSIRYTQRLAEAGIENSARSVGDSYDNALAETIIGLFKTEVIRRCGPWCFYLLAKETSCPVRIRAGKLIVSRGFQMMRYYRPYRLLVRSALLEILLLGASCDPRESDETGPTNDDEESGSDTGVTSNDTGEESGSDTGVSSSDTGGESGSDTGDSGCPDRQEVVAEFSISAIPYDNRSLDISSDCAVLEQGGHEISWAFRLDCDSGELWLELEAQPGQPFADVLQGPVRLEYREVGGEKWVALKSEIDSLAYFGVDASSLTPPGENPQEWFAPAEVEIMTTLCPAVKNGCSKAMRMSVSVNGDESPVFDGSWLPGVYVEEAISCEDDSDGWIDFLVYRRI